MAEEVNLQNGEKGRRIDISSDTEISLGQEAGSKAEAWVWAGSMVEMMIIQVLTGACRSASCSSESERDLEHEWTLWMRFLMAHNRKSQS